MATGSSHTPSWAKHADFTVIDLASMVAAFVLAYRLKFGDFGFVESSRWRTLLATLLLLDLVVTLATNPYGGILRRGYWEDVGRSLWLAIQVAIPAVVAFYLLKIGAAFSREVLVTTFVAYIVLTLVLKALYKKVLLSRRGSLPADSLKRLVVVTTSDYAQEAERLACAADVTAYEVVGFCLADIDDEGELLDRPSAPLGSVVSVCSRLNADEVLLTVDPALVGADALEELVEDGVRLRLAVEKTLGVGAENMAVGRVGTFETLDLERYSFGSGQMLYLPVKRAADIAFGVLGTLAMLVVAAAVKVACVASGDTAPIFYRQTRIGLRGEPFDLLKLRSMVPNAAEALEELLEDPRYREEWERDQKLSDDPRVTPVGRVLRRTSMDELPQFVNVLRGDMSVIGPRPLVPGELEEHGGRSLYNRVKPGITGWWGCNGRSNIGYEERLELEYYYVRNCSLYLDVLCVLRTVAAVLRRDGAK